MDTDHLQSILEPLPKRTGDGIRKSVTELSAPTVYAAYNAATYYATHQMRSYRTAFDLLQHINRGFQESFPLPRV